jgi:hypothetical protein
MVWSLGARVRIESGHETLYRTGTNARKSATRAEPGTFQAPQNMDEEAVTDSDSNKQCKCPKCAAACNIIVVPLRTRDDVSRSTNPDLQFLCDQCRTILSVTLDPEWQAQIVAGQLRTVGERSGASH